MLLVQGHSRAFLRISQTLLLLGVLVSASSLSIVSSADGSVVTIDNALKITVIPPVETANPGGTVTVTLIVSNPGKEATFVATGCILWAPIQLSSVPLYENCAIIDQLLNFPYYFPPGDVEVWIISESVAPKFPPLSLPFKLLIVGYWGDLNNPAGCCFPAISQYAYFTAVIT